MLFRVLFTLLCVSSLPIPLNKQPLLSFNGHPALTFTFLLWSIVLRAPTLPLLSLSGRRDQATGLAVTQILSPSVPMLNTLMISTASDLALCSL